jgi:hypothetical protein
MVTGNAVACLQRPLKASLAIESRESPKRLTRKVTALRRSGLSGPDVVNFHHAQLRRQAPPGDEGVRLHSVSNLLSRMFLQ